MGTYSVSGAIATAYATAGGEGGALGYPTTGLICGRKTGGCGQVFQRGHIYNTTATGAHALTGAIDATYVAQGWEQVPLGSATSDARAVAGGVAQDFQGGTLYSSSAGTFAASGAIATAYVAAGGPGGALGFPTTGLICGM